MGGKNWERKGGEKGEQRDKERTVRKITRGNHLSKLGNVPFLNGQVR